MQLYLKRQLLISSCIYIGTTLGGYMTGWTTPMIPILQDTELTPLPEAITDQQASLVGSFLYIGFLFSAFISGYISNKKGRKLGLILGGVVAIIAHLLVLFSVNLPMLLFARTMIGLGTGIIFVQNLVYLTEIASTNIRGILLTGIGVFSSLGTLLAFCVGPYVSYAATCYVGLGNAVVFILGIYFIPESPVFKILQGKENEAKEILATLGRPDDLKDIILLKDEKEKSINYLEIVTVKTNRKTLLLLIALFLLQTMSGSVAMLVYATFIFELANVTLDSNISTIIFGTTLLLTSCICPIFVERAGRRVLLIISSAFCCIFQALMGIYFFLEEYDYPIVESIQWLPLVSKIGFFLAYNSGLAIIPPTLTGEMFASEIRSVASAITLFFNWIFSFIISMTFGFMVSALGSYITFWIYSGSCAIAFVFSVFLVPETKGKSLVEIQLMLNK